MLGEEDYSELKEGTQEIEITYMEKTATFSITVEKVKENEIKVTSEKYEIGEKTIKGISPETEVEELLEELKTEEEGITLEIEKEDGEKQEEGLIATGMKVIIKQGEEEKGSYKLIVKGDVRANGKIDIGDILEVARSIAGVTKLTEEQNQAGDLNKDNKCNIKDILVIARIIADIVKIEEI